MTRIAGALPIVLGSGVSMFQGLANKRGLKLGQTRMFANGNVLLSYERARLA